jgi:hypothetical protein
MSAQTTPVMEPAKLAIPLVPREESLEGGAFRAETLRSAQGIEVLEVIVHIVDHRNRSEPVLSGAPVDLKGDRRLTDYFTKLIENVIGDPEAAEAVFLDANAGVAPACREILRHPATFVERSGDLARSLWDATGTDRRISPGSLIVCRFRAASLPRMPLLALFKIDPTDVLVQTVLEVKGRQVVTLKVAENALPTARERLQKAALIAVPGSVRLGDVLLLDRLVTQPAAAFFALDFLGASPRLSQRQRTDKFLEGLLEAIAELANPPTPEAPSLSEEETDELEEEGYQAVDGRELNPALWVESRGISDAAKTVIHEKLAKKDLDLPQFTTDRTRSKRPKKNRYQGDYDVRIEFSTLFVDYTLTDLPRNAAGDPVTRICLDVPNLKRSA